METNEFERTDEQLVENLAFLIWKEGYHIDGYPNYDTLLHKVGMDRSEVTQVILKKARVLVKTKTAEIAEKFISEIPPNPFRVTLRSGKVLVSSDYVSPIQTKENLMNLTKEQAQAILLGTGHTEEVVNGMSVKRMEAKINGLKDYDDVTEPADQETNKVFKDAMKAMESGEEVHVDGDNSDPIVPKNKKSKKKEKAEKPAVDSVLENEELEGQPTHEDPEPNHPPTNENKKKTPNSKLPKDEKIKKLLKAPKILTEGSKSIKRKPVEIPKEEPKKEVKKVKEFDSFGFEVGTEEAKINSALTNKSKTMLQLKRDSGANGLLYNHLQSLVKAGKVVDEGGTYKLA